MHPQTSEHFSILILEFVFQTTIRTLNLTSSFSRCKSLQVQNFDWFSKRKYFLNKKELKIYQNIKSESEREKFVCVRMCGRHVLELF